MSFRIRDYAHPVVADIDLSVRLRAEQFDQSVNGCAARATEALRGSASGYAEWDRNHIGSIFQAMQITHKSIRVLVQPKEPSPTSIDALPLTRVQLESLFAICLMLEDSKWVAIYIKDGWKKAYKRVLLERQEFGNLPRCVESLKQLQLHIDNLTQISGVTENERRTVEREELGIPLPPGMLEVAIPQFPTPRRIIGKIKEIDRKEMLIRLYNDYSHLSTYVHGLPEAVTLKQGFGKYKDHFSSKQHEVVFQKEVVQPALFFSLFAVLQAASELITLYPNDIDLRATVTKGWNLLSNHSLLGKVFWEIRAKRLLGSI